MSEKTKEIVLDNRVWGYVSILAWITNVIWCVSSLIICSAILTQLKDKDKLVAKHVAAAFNFQIVMFLIGLPGLFLYLVSLYSLQPVEPELIGLSRAFSQLFLLITSGVNTFYSIKNCMNLNNKLDPEYFYRIKLLEEDYQVVSK